MRTYLLFISSFILLSIVNVSIANNLCTDGNSTIRIHNKKPASIVIINHHVAIKQGYFFDRKSAHQVNVVSQKIGKINAELYCDCQGPGVCVGLVKDANFYCTPSTCRHGCSEDIISRD